MRSSCLLPSYAGLPEAGLDASQSAGFGPGGDHIHDPQCNARPPYHNHATEHAGQRVQAEWLWGLAGGLVISSVLFGIGWGLAGLGPGPALAAASFDGRSGIHFLLAMMAGMVATPAIRVRIDRLAAA